MVGYLPGSSSISVDLCYPNMFGSCARVVGGFPVPGLWACVIYGRYTWFPVYGD